MQKSFLFFRKSIDDRSPLAEYVDTYDDPNGSKSRFIQTQVAQGRSTWAQVFDAYVQSGYYSKFIRDISRIFSPEEIQQINRNIRQNHIDNASSGNSPTATLLRGASLSDDGNEIDLPEESRQMLRQQEPSLRRLLVGNHGIYAESSSPNAGEMIRVAPQGQYEHWQNGDRKYYKQLRGVNYADYRPGMWYAALGDYNLEPQRITLRQVIDSQNPFMPEEFLQHLDEEDTDYPFEDHTDAPVKVQGILSNFSPQDGGLIVNGKRYKTPEHLYQSLKFKDSSHRQQIVGANTAREAKEISRDLSALSEGNSFRTDWQDIQDHIMRWVVSQRMEQQPSFRQALLATGDRPIIEDEGSRPRTRWGTTRDGQSFRGQNVMGKILMSVRDQYRAQAERDRSEDSPPTSNPALTEASQQPPSTVSINNNDIFNSNADAIVNSVNTRLSPNGRGVMGAGLAKTFKDIFGENSDYFRGYERAISRGEGYIYDANGRVAEGTRFGPGMARIYKITDADRQRAQEALGRPFTPKYIIDAAVKRSWQEQSSSQWVQDAITSAGHAIRESGTIFSGQSEPISSIVFPVLGSNMGSRGVNVPGMPPPPTREQSIQMLQNGLSQYGVEASISIPNQISPASNTGAPVIQQAQSQTPASFSIADVPPQRSRPKSSNIEELAEIVHPASEDEDHEAMRRQSRIIIAGPRTSTLAPNGDASKGELAGQALAVWLGRSLFPEHFGKDLSVISGGAYGSDQSGEILAELLGIPALAMPARWNEVGAAHSQGNSRVAGPVRNAAMANRATGAIITLPSWHDIKFKVINNGGNAAIKIDPSIFGTSPTRNITFSLSSENSLQNIIDLLKGDTSDEKKDLFRETFGVEIPNGLKEEDIKEAMMLAISRGNVDLPDSIKDSDLYKEAMGKWDGQPDTDEEMENIHQSRSTGSISMSQTAENRKLPTIRVFRSHSRGGGKIREITVSPPTTALRVAVPQFVLYSSDDPEKAQEDAERLKTYLGMSGDTFHVPSQDEIQGRLERISSFFNGRGTDLFGRKDATQLSGYKRVADHSYWSPSKEQIDEIEAHELTHMIDEHGLDTIPGMAAPVKIPRGAVPVIHGKQSRGSVSESFTSGSPPQTYLSMGRSSRIPPEKLSIIPAVAREAVFGNGEIHPKTIVDRVRPRLQMSYKSKIFPFALWPIR